MNLELDQYGFLKDRSCWSEAVALWLAEQDGLQLTDGHWEIVYCMRDYYQRYNHLPNARLFGRAVKQQLGDEKGASRYLYRLFPDGPLKFACKYAGLPIPPSCI